MRVLSDNASKSRLCKLLSESSSGVPAMMHSPHLPWKARELGKKQLTKPTVQFILSLSIFVMDFHIMFWEVRSAG